MKIEDYRDGKLITLSKAFDNRAKVLNVFYFIVFLSTGTFVLKGLIQNEIEFSFPFIFFVCLVVACYIAGYRFFNKAATSEQLLVTQNTIQVTQKGAFTEKQKVYTVSKIFEFRHLSKEKLTDHPLAGQSFDYLGFQTEQKVINEMHGDNRIGFHYEGRDISFGENIYSWDFEEIEVIVSQITGRDLSKRESYDDLYITAAEPKPTY